MYLKRNVLFQTGCRWTFLLYKNKKYKKVIDKHQNTAYNATHTKQTKPIKIV